MQVLQSTILAITTQLLFSDAAQLSEGFNPAEFGFQFAIGLEGGINPIYG